MPEKARIQIAALLQGRLADSIDLTIQAKHAHWNVKGANFIGLHELFDRIAEESEKYSDLIAERIVQLGAIAEGTLESIVKRTTLPEYPMRALAPGTQHVSAFSHALANFSEQVREAVEQVEELDDVGTSDLLVEILRSVDKNLWFVEAHVQGNIDSYKPVAAV